MNNIEPYVKKLREMVALQEEVNCLIEPDWRLKQQDYSRAIWIECAELMDHVGWKWWKRQTLNLEQIKFELIDIWHFALCIMLQDKESLETKIKSAAVEFKAIGARQSISSYRLLLSTENLARAALTGSKFDQAIFCDAMRASGMAFDDLYIGYIGKNVLNTFRQKNGYKEGRYSKIWGGREDNEWLAELLTTTDSNSDHYRVRLYSELENVYRVTSKTAEADGI